MTEPAENDGAGLQPTTHFAFVINVRQLVDHDSFELAPGHLLRRANSDERLVIRTVLQRWPVGSPINLGTGLWELPWPNATGPLVPLPEEQWRYFVITFEGSNQTLLNLETACDLGPIDLEVGFTILATPAPGFAMTQSSPARLFHALEDSRFGNSGFFQDVTLRDVDALRSINRALAAHDHEFLDLRPLLGQIRSLKALQHGSPLRFLGYFGVLEALLTHAPSPKDPYDSITRQVKKKIALLDNRWRGRLDYSPFGGAAPDKIWTAMYAYRSKLAHGTTPDFSGGDFRLLGDRQRALRLLIETVKAAMVHALVEPRLVADLKEC